NGMFAAASLVFCALWLDWRRISARFAGAVAAPYVAGAVAWGLYILRAPAEFAAQFGANSANRWGDLLHPLQAIYREFALRYLLHHFLPASGGAFAWMKLTGLLLFAGAIAAVI